MAIGKTANLPAASVPFHALRRHHLHPDPKPSVT